MSNIVKDDALLKYLKPEHAVFYINEIFKNAIDIDPAWMIELRKVGKFRMLDGTTQPCEQVSPVQLLQFGQDNPIPGLAEWVGKRLFDAAPLGVGLFMAPALLDDRKATDASVKRLVTVCADFDTGNPQANLDALCKRLRSRPTILARSGGITQEGYYKLHAHWRLDEPCDEPWKIAYIREQIAKLHGADSSFKRIPQIIRIPGSLYDKDGRWATVEIIEHNNVEVGALQWEENFSLDFHNLADDSIFNRAASTKTKEERIERVHAIHTEEIHAGGTEETRFGRFSEYAGHQIRQARFGHQTEEEAFKSVQIWVQEKMVPAWDNQRVAAEFRALLQRDKINHSDTWAERTKPPITLNAPLANPSAPADTPVADPAAYGIGAVGRVADAVPSQPEGMTLDIYEAGVLYAGSAPPERHLVDNFIVHGGMFALVADGGVGKTYLTLELALRCAAGPMPNNNFMGFEIKEKMNVVVLTVEDGQYDIHRRLMAIDYSGDLRKASLGHCVIMPVREALIDGLTLASKDSSGNYSSSSSWKLVIKLIEDYLGRNPERSKYPLLIMIDTYSATHHGDENNAVAVNEWFRAAGAIKRFDATLFLTHHTKKTDPKAEIKTVEDMKAAVRGSTAFMNSLRGVYGVWPMPNGEAVLKEVIGREPGQRLFNLGMLKNNTGISWAERSNPKFQDPLITLKRLGTGRLTFDEDIHNKRLELGDGKKERIAAAKAQLRAAIKHAVLWYSEQGWPVSQRIIEEEKDSFLPSPVNAMSKKDVKSAIEELLNKEGSIKQVSGVTPKGEVLDAPEGPFYSGTQKQRVPTRPNIVWAQWKYDDEKETYTFIPNSKGSMSF